MLNLVILAVQYIVQSEMIEFRLKSGLYGFISSTYMRNSQNSMLNMYLNAGINPEQKNNNQVKKWMGGLETYI